jgi:predicted nucleic acid-binding protein
MVKYVFDTCIWISRPRPKKMPQSLLMSSVVVFELTYKAPDAANLKNWEHVMKAFDNEKKLLVPTGEDWYLAAKVLYNLGCKPQRYTKGKAKEKAIKISPEEKERLFRDVLIARTVKSAGATLITDNVRDFEKIKKYCQVNIISGDEYFANSQTS